MCRGPARARAAFALKMYIPGCRAGEGPRTLCPCGPRAPDRGCSAQAEGIGYNCAPIGQRDPANPGASKIAFPPCQSRAQDSFGLPHVSPQHPRLCPDVTSGWPDKTSQPPPRWRVLPSHLSRVPISRTRTLRHMEWLGTRPFVPRAHVPQSPSFPLQNN